MATNSAEPGYLEPSASPVYDDGLEDILQAAIVGITGLAGTLVRPRWQPEPPQQPDFAIDWCAFGLTDTEVDTFAYDKHDPAGQGVNRVQRDEVLTVLHSFYGPNAHANCERLRDGFEVSQNRDFLRTNGITLIEVGKAQQLPALVKEKWVKRIDTTIQYRRRTSRTFQVLTITSAQGQIVTEEYTVPIVVTNP